MAIRFTIHPVAAEPGTPDMYALIPNDDTRGYMIGELADLESLQEAATAALLGLLGDRLDECDERLGAKWITLPDALEMAEGGGEAVSRALISRACRLGQIAGAKRDSRGWTFPQRRFLGWLHNRKRSPGPAAKWHHAAPIDGRLDAE